MGIGQNDMVNMYGRTSVDVCRSILCDMLLLQADLDPDPTPQIEACTEVYCTAVWCAGTAQRCSVAAQLERDRPSMALMWGGEKDAEEERSG